MKTLTHIFLCLLCIGSILNSSAQESENHTITVTIDGITSDRGTIRVGLYNTPDDFLNSPYTSTYIKAVKGNVQVVFKNVPKGQYAISVYQDVDDNEVLNTVFGIPTEPYGTSNNAKGYFGPPKWEDAKFTTPHKETMQHITL
ncbi:DUF2141 domain-containing protein [Aquimarina longa]|uniref:DUF2141 domain-containing protein n=1 Tax=Aquimarina longa TaxID=1080221 RepID=UPI000782E57B|nr:DUF2141 domain-containing protein [Aquimarina longa]